MPQPVTNSKRFCAGTSTWASTSPSTPSLTIGLPKRPKPRQPLWRCDPSQRLGKKQPSPATARRRAWWGMACFPGLAAPPVIGGAAALATDTAARSAREAAAAAQKPRRTRSGPPGIRRLQPESNRDTPRIFGWNARWPRDGGGRGTRRRRGSAGPALLRALGPASGSHARRHRARPQPGLHR